ncbi:MAG: hypothetical protein ACK4ZN_05440 [Oceanibaculum sp.]
MNRKNIFFKHRPRRRFGWMLGAGILAVGLSWSLYGGFQSADLPECDSAAVRQEIRKALAAGLSGQGGGVEMVAWRENRRRMAGDIVESRDCAARTMQDGTLGIVRYTVMQRSDGAGFHVDMSGQEAQQDARR